MKISKAELERIKAALPTGGMTMIANAIGKSRQFVSLVLNAKVPFTASCVPVIEAANKLIKKENKKSIELSQSINDALNGAA